MDQRNHSARSKLLTSPSTSSTSFRYLVYYSRVCGYTQDCAGNGNHLHAQKTDCLISSRLLTNTDQAAGSKVSDGPENTLQSGSVLFVVLKNSNSTQLIR